MAWVSSRGVPDVFADSGAGMGRDRKDRGVGCCDRKRNSGEHSHPVGVEGQHRIFRALGWSQHLPFLSPASQLLPWFPKTKQGHFCPNCCLSEVRPNWPPPLWPEPLHSCAGSISAAQFSKMQEAFHPQTLPSGQGPLAPLTVLRSPPIQEKALHAPAWPPNCSPVSPGQQEQPCGVS